MREQDLTKVRWILMTITELEAAAMTLLEAIEQTREDLRPIVETQ